MNRYIRTALPLLVAGLSLASVLPAPAATTPTVRPALADRRAERVLAGLRRAGVPPALLASRPRVSDHGRSDNASVVDAGDLDGDGLVDLLDVRERADEVDVPGGVEYRYVTTVDARRGRTGALLWSRTFEPNESVYPVVAKVGLNGAPGVLFVRYADAGQFVGAPVGGAWAGSTSLTLTAVDGRGNVVWTRSASGANAFAFALVEAAGAGTGIWVADVADLVTGGATDVLLAAVAGVGAAAYPEVVRVVAIDGRDGALSDTGVGAVQPHGVVDVVAVPDQSGDQLADVAVLNASFEGEATLSVHAGRDGRQLWSKQVTVDPYAATTVLPDVTGDKVADLALVNMWYDSPATLVDGSDGRTLWAKPGYPVALGDVNRDGVGEIAMLSYPGEGARISAEVFDASGRRRWSVVRSLPTGSGRSVRVTRVVTGVGDLNGDGVTDLGYALAVSAAGVPERRDDGWIDGRTGRVRRDPVPGLIMVRGAVDGRGRDLAGYALKNGKLTVTTYAGDTGRLLWRSSVAVDRRWTTAWFDHASTATVRRCATVFVTAMGATGPIQTVALGPDGVPVWSITRDGGSGNATVTKPAAVGRVNRNRCR